MALEPQCGTVSDDDVVHIGLSYFSNTKPKVDLPRKTSTTPQTSKWDHTVPSSECANNPESPYYKSNNKPALTPEQYLGTKEAADEVVEIHERMKESLNCTRCFGTGRYDPETTCYFCRNGISNFGTYQSAYLLLVDTQFQILLEGYDGILPNLVQQYTKGISISELWPIVRKMDDFLVKFSRNTHNQAHFANDFKCNIVGKYLTRIQACADERHSKMLKLDQFCRDNKIEGADCSEKHWFQAFSLVAKALEKFQEHLDIAYLIFRLKEL
jgi:hypothetical protein